MSPRDARLEAALRALPLVPAVILVGVLASVWARRFPYPFDLEWMESGMLAHAWRVASGEPLYGPPNLEFIPFVYPPGYAWVVAGLARIFGLGMQLGRAVSIVSILAAAGALAFALRRAGASIGLGFGVAAAFLGTYPQAGAFYDIVRPDALGLALLAWAIVLGLEDRPSAPVIAGLLLAASFLVKHNAAIAGVPMLVGFAARGWRPAARFAGASIVPALAAVAALQWTTDGHFVTWLVDVPRSQALLWTRARIDTPREWGTALPIASAFVGLAACWAAAARQRTVPPWLAAGAPVWGGLVLAWWYTYEPPPPGSGISNGAAGLAYWAIGAVPLALALGGVGWAADRQRDGAPVPDWRLVYGAGLAVALGATSLLMRVHDGGFINVHTPFFWCLTGAFGALLLRLERAGRAGRLIAPAALAVQLTWSLALVRPARLIPTAESAAVGWRFVEAARGIEGPILSPFSAWIPIYAGHDAPSLHGQGVWDVNYRGGPYQDDLVVIEEALRDHHWTLIIGGQAAFLGDLTRHYEVREELLSDTDPRFIPPTGVAVRPWRILVPRR